YGTGLRLLEIAPLRIELRSKLERGCRLLESTTAEPQAEHSLPFGLKPDMTVEESLRKIGLGGLRLFLRNELAALAGVSEGVHQMRVAVRRLRSAIATMKRMLPQEQYEWVSQELRWLANILAAARNWDVLSSSLLAPVRSALPNDQDLIELCCICRARASIRLSKRQCCYPVATIHSCAAEAVAVVRLVRLAEPACLATFGAADGANRYRGA